MQRIISRRQAAESSKRSAILSALEKTEQAAASKTADELYKYYLENKSSFHALFEGGLPKSGHKGIGSGFFELLANEDGVFKTGDDITGIYLLIHDGKVKFYARYNVVSNPGLLSGRSMQQVEFYRISNSHYTVNIAKHILFDCLLLTYKTILTNTHLTLYEKNIWVHAIVCAFDEYPEKYSVHLIDMQDADHKAVKITSRDQFSSLIDRAWWVENAEQSLRLVITQIG